MKVMNRDSSTICVKPAGLPLVTPGTKVKVTRNGRSVEFVSGYSTVNQLCAAKGSGRALHNLLTGISGTTPEEIEVEIGS